MTDAAPAAQTRDETPDLGDLPRWDLADLYPGRDSDALKTDLDEAQAESGRFAEAYAGKLETLSGAALAEAIRRYERLSDTLGRVMSFAYLDWSLDQTDGAGSRFLQAMQERVTRISGQTLFFTLELNRMDEAALEAKLADPGLAHYRPWLRDVRAMRPHQLSDELEKYIHDKSVAGSSSWVRLFDETMASLRFRIGGKEVAVSEALNGLTDHRPERRKESALEISRVLEQNVRLFAHITNTLAKDKAVDDEWRHFAQPWSSRNLSNFVEDEVVDALLEAVRAAYPDISHRYYRLKARWFGVEKLPYWDRNAPLPDEDDRIIGWDEASDIVLTAYDGFSPRLGEVGRRFFDNRGWIDAPAVAGKASGAYSHPTVPSAHPYLLLNYLGKTRDVMTLAHELGHGVHQALAGKQGALMADTPLTLAETASVFGEMLTFRSLLARTTDPKRRRAMLAAKVEDMINTVVRQIAFFEFERRVHTARQEGEVSVEDLGEIWMGIQTESLGDAFTYDDSYRVYWSYIPHFIHAPFYVYAYAFGDCLVNSLYAVYQEAEAGFPERYLEMLEAGGTKRHKGLLAPFGLDASDPAFWRKGLSMITGLIDELEAIEG